MPQLQHNMLVTRARRAYLSILTSGGKWVVIEVDADPVYQTVFLQVERIFWRCVSTGEVPVVYGAVPPKVKRPVVTVVDMSVSNVWSECAAIFARTRKAHAEHEATKSELKLLGPEDAGGLRPRRSSQALQIRRDQLRHDPNGGDHASV